MTDALLIIFELLSLYLIAFCDYLLTQIKILKNNAKICDQFLAQKEVLISEQQRTIDKANSVIADIYDYVQDFNK
jgi:hypothetical protein